ncbi:MAG: hypothetical protein C0392_14735 [Syntrophus sp. (in: bacteria)]|nr:hypothetical protein [Syntrophus sp. (in: bacteria)]
MVIRCSLNLDMFTDERFDCVTVQEVCEEIFRTQRFKTKYPWRSDYKGRIHPIQWPVLITLFHLVENSK